MKNSVSSQKKRFFRRSVLFVIFSMFALHGCSKSSEDILAERIANMEAGSNNPGKTPEAIKDEISGFYKDAQKVEELHGKIAVWNKVMGVRYMNKGMYRDALASFEEAAVMSDNANYWRLAGYCSMILGIRDTGSDSNANPTNTRERYLKKAQKCYENALAVDSRHLSSLKELGYMFACVMKDGKKGIPYLEKALEISTKDSEIMTNLAQAYFLAGRYSDADAMYDRIISNTKSPELKDRALENKKFVDDNYLYAN